MNEIHQRTAATNTEEMMAEYRRDLDAQISDVMPESWEGHQRLAEGTY